MVDGLASIRSVPPRGTYEERLKTLITFITPTAEAWANRIIMETYIEISVQVRNQKVFRAGKVSWNKGTSINILCITHKRKALQGKPLEFFTPK